MTHPCIIIKEEEGGWTMKKIIMIITTLVLFMSLGASTTVSANSGPPVRGITVLPSVCTVPEEDDMISIYEGNYDILVRIDDFDSSDFDTMSAKYQAEYPFYEDIDYLSNVPEGYISFSAYYKRDSKWGPSSYMCGVQFADKDIVKQMEDFYLIYFDDNGDTLFMSEKIDVPNVYFYQDRDSIIYFDTESLTIETDLDPFTDPYFLLYFVMIVGFILFSVIIEVVVALVFKFHSKKELLNILFINIATQALMYLYFFVIYDSHSGDYYLQLYIFEGIVLLIEFAYLYWRLKLTISWKRLAIYVVVSNVISYVLGLLRYY